MTWTEQVPAFAGAFACVVAIFLIPGAGLLWLARVRGLVAWALGPAVSALLYGTAAVVLDRVGLPWGLPAVLAAAVPAAGVALLLGRWRRHDPPLRTAQLPTMVIRALWTAALLAGALLVIGVFAGMPDLAAPLQVRDAVVHLNGLELVRQDHNASMFGGLDLVVSSAGAGAFYPSLWHGALALVPFGSAGVVSTAGMLAVATVLWPLSMVALARAVLPAQPWAVVVVAALSTSFSFFPFGQLVLSAQWPNGLGTAMIPAVLAATVLWVRSWHDAALAARVRRRRALSGAVVLAGAVGGMVLVHPNTVFSYLVFAGPLLLAVAWRAWRAHPRTGRTVVWVVAGVVVAAAGVAAAARVSGLDRVLKDVMGYQQILPERPYLFTIARLLGDTTLASVPGNVLLSAAVLTGVVVLLRERRLRWVVLAWALTIALAALAGGPEIGLRGITGFWYKHVFRLEALYPITAVLLAAVGVGWWANRLHTRWSARVRDKAPRGAGRLVSSPVRAGATVLAAVLASSVVLGVPAMATRSAGVYDPENLGARLLVSADDRRLLDRLPELVPADAVVLGDPNAGAVLIFSYGSRTPVYYRIGADWLGTDQLLLALHFDEVSSDPAVCEALARLGVEYFYLSSDREDKKWPSNLATHALRAVDTASGFELLASEGAAQLFRITACE
ncbi:hypothetical protein SAMN05216410_1575 [Sanguibacter gelidistatuariae]|uniref:4-amino-4-deoxy-L-arabinose transferase n=1 Tax=Sanguibacter gelidistatuariae TaxID=1814289 RepID=A0A1G6KEE3_9MICO|nr:DUF6541 family protein [Sanguibacter gelidistatuariae]SDC29314.1 hypothetical protein SAMN05216410_1575 [Sanguibacter gelidistatuariae]